MKKSCGLTKNGDRHKVKYLGKFLNVCSVILERMDEKDFLGAAAL